MSKENKGLMQQLAPFLVLGVAVAVIVGLFIMFSYLILWGIVIGAVLWVISKISRYFSSPGSTKKPSGRIIEHDKDK